MSKSKINRREKILDKALEMFNERGIEYVGLRELAAILGMRVSNITYYFPTKDDLVYALSQELTKLNADTLEAMDALSMKGFLERLQKAFDNHQKFRCLLLSIVHINRQNVHLAVEYKKTQAKRQDTFLNNMQTLEAAGYLVAMDQGDMELLVSGISLVSRFWLSEATVSYKQWSTGAQKKHYLVLITKLLLPYCTVKGKKEIDAFSKTV